MASEPVDAACPLCGRPLVVTDRGWRCRMWGPTVGGCTFSLFRHWRHVRLTAADVAQLCRQGTVAVVKGDQVLGWVYVDRRGGEGGCAWSEGPARPRPAGMRRARPAVTQRSLFDRGG